MSKILQYYVIPSGINKEIADVIIKTLETNKLQESKTFANSSIRSSKNFWIAGDSWIGGMMAHFINAANDNLFQYHLTNWENEIQYTVYDKPGDRYGWHTDLLPGNPPFIRKLSISLCLSSIDDYEGGELQLKVGTDYFNIKMDCGDAVIFSSDCPHRIRSIRSGKRVSLVGWYGGPKFK